MSEPVRDVAGRPEVPILTGRRFLLGALVVGAVPLASVQPPRSDDEILDGGVP